MTTPIAPHDIDEPASSDSGAPEEHSHKVDPGILRDLLEESRRLRADVVARSETQRKFTRMALAAVVVTIMLLGIQLTILLQNRRTSAETRAVIRENASTSQQIADCTTAGGRCFEEGSKRSAERTQGQIRAQTEIAVCQRFSTTEDQLRKCVSSALNVVEAPAAPSAGDAPR
jgi:hypothetical protein